VKGCSLHNTTLPTARIERSADWEGGRAKVDLSALEEQSTHVIQLSTQTGEPLYGHKGDPTVLQIAVRVHADAGAGQDEDEDEDEDEGAGGTWAVKVTAVSYKHMPKMDRLGTIDPYLVIMLGHERHETSVRQGYEGSWGDEQVAFVGRRNLRGNINIQLYDKNTFGRDDFVGSVRVPVSAIRNKQAPGEETEAFYELRTAGGAVVNGHDGKPARLNIRCASAAAPSPPRASPLAPRVWQKVGGTDSSASDQVRCGARA